MFTRYDPFLREKIWTELWEVDRLEEFPVYFLAFLDVALWDIQSKALGVPTYKLLGGHKSRARAYASTVTFDLLDDYLRAIDRCPESGYRAVKLHVWGRVSDDIKLVRAVRKHVGSEIELMLEGSAGYSLDEAVLLGRALEDAGYLWLEEPIREPPDQLELQGWIHRSPKRGSSGGVVPLQSDVHGGDHASLALVCALPNSQYFESMFPDECFPDATMGSPMIRPNSLKW